MAASSFVNDQAQCTLYMFAVHVCLHSMILITTISVKPTTVVIYKVVLSNMKTCLPDIIYTWLDLNTGLSSVQDECVKPRRVWEELHNYDQLPSNIAPKDVTSSADGAAPECPDVAVVQQVAAKPATAKGPGAKGCAKMPGKGHFR